MSHATAMARIATMLNPSGTDLSSTTGATETAPNRSISSTSYQSAQRNDQRGSTGFGQPVGPPSGQGPPRGSSGSPPQAAVLQRVVQAPHGTNGAMRGQPPTIFNGEKSKTNQFVTEFQLWWMTNRRAEAMNNPFQRAILCLSFIRGPEVDNWVEEKINQLRRAVLGDPANGIPPTHHPTEEALWNNFGADFRAAYQDTAAEENAYAQLKGLRMVKDRIDKYIAHFEVLLTRAGWSQRDKGSIDIFFNGLTKAVQRKILSLYATLPITINEWQTAARQVVQRYRLMDVKIGPWKPKVGTKQERPIQKGP